MGWNFWVRLGSNELEYLDGESMGWNIWNELEWKFWMELESNEQENLN
jgi:hypothetical protein